MNKIIAIAAAALALSAQALDDTVTDSDGNVWARQGSLGRNDYVLTNAPGLPKTGGTMTGGLSLGTNELSFAGAVGPGDEYATNLWDRIRVYPSGLGSSIGLASMIWSYVPSAVSSGAWPAVSNRTAELIRSSSVSVDAYTRAETDARLAKKADEFTEWELDEVLQFNVLPTFDGSGRWYCSIWDASGNSNDCYAYGERDATVLHFSGGEIGHVSVTRKRVLRTGDAAARLSGWRLLDSRLTFVDSTPIWNGYGWYARILDEYGFISDCLATAPEDATSTSPEDATSTVFRGDAIFDDRGAAVRGRVLYEGDPELVAPFENWRTNTYSIAIGSNSVANVNRGIAIGLPNASGAPTTASAATSIAIGVGAKTTGGSSLAIGSTAIASAANAVQIGSGSNTEAGTLKFRGYTLVNADGRIPVYRLPAGGADVQADMLDGVYYRRLIYDGSVYYVAVTNMPPLPQEQETDDPEETEP